MLQKKDKSKILFFRESSFKVAELIFNYPNRTFHIRKLAKETKQSTTAVISAIQDLHRFKIVRVDKTDLATHIKADTESDAYRFYKRVFNLYRLERYAIIDDIEEEFQAESIILFGSFSRGEDIEESDVDILIITNHEAPEDIADSLAVYEKELNRKINLHILPSLERSSKEFKNAAANGIVLRGYLKVL
ncbi:nucleotidyltransferase domain-containing protein [Candidatus Woesearchaeota archaeon]|nr:nucleotidyltransferase domain-containing protein [Candidatus Woesearchaeota archaeon]